jgi:peptide deformylase
MAVVPVLLYPHPLLKQPTPLADPQDPEVGRVFVDLVDTLRHHRGCVGLAAPQIGRSLRAMVVDVSGSPRARDHHGLVCLLNPVVLEATQWKVSREGCLSFPDLLANVKRAQKVRLQGSTPDGMPLDLAAAGFEAVALQHEVDHLDGIVFLDRIRSSRDLFERRRSAEAEPEPPTREAGGE